MTTPLPTLRDLPADRHAEIRAELLRTMDRPPRRSWLVPVLAGAAAAVVLAVIVLLPGDRSRSAPPAWYRDDSLELPPGVTADERTEIEHACAGNEDEDYRLHNAISDEVGTFAFLIDGTSKAPCAVDYQERPYSKLVMAQQPEALRWLPGPMVLDQHSAAHAFAGRPGYDLAVGRVRGDVASVRMSIGVRTVDAVLANDTFIVRMIHSATNQPRAGSRVYLHAYDAEGNLVDTWKTDKSTPGECYVLPDGRYMTEGGEILPNLPPDQFDLPNCPPASPWR
jgi:hypothetical protein